MGATLGGRGHSVLKELKDSRFEEAAVRVVEGEKKFITLRFFCYLSLDAETGPRSE